MPKGNTFIIGAATGLAQAGLYLVFAANVGVRELVAAVLTAAVATMAVLVFATAGQVRFRLRLRDVMQAWRLPWYVLSGTAQVMRALGQQLFTRAGAASHLAAVRFDGGEQENLADAGRRALAVTYTTATPNCIVLGLVQEQGIMLYHQIVPGPVIAITRRLGARP